MAKENVKISKEKVGFVKGTIIELKQVTWPTKKDLAIKTAVVLAVVIISTLFVYLVDKGLSGILKLIVN